MFLDRIFFLTLNFHSFLCDIHVCRGIEISGFKETPILSKVTLVLWQTSHMEAQHSRVPCRELELSPVPGSP